jgi:transcriptional regulator with XRE-family HTH domain
MINVRGFYKNSGVELRNALAHAGKRPSELARILKVTDQQVNNILMGKAKIPAKHLKVIATTCSYDYDLLLEAVIRDERARLDHAAQISCIK